jgi:hypothetical protein
MSQTERVESPVAELPPSPTTDDIEWRDSYESFELMGMGRFDVNAARRIVEAEPRTMHILDAESVGQWWAAFGVFLRLEDTDEEINMGIPVFIAMASHRGSRTHLIIDGWHRVQRAYTLGEPLLFVVLDEDETDQIHTPWK